MTRHFLRDDDLSPAEQTQVLEPASTLRRSPYESRVLAGPRTVATMTDPRAAVTGADVLDGPKSDVWDEAENRRHAQRAIISWLLEFGSVLSPGEAT